MKHYNINSNDIKIILKGHVLAFSVYIIISVFQFLFIFAEIERILESILFIISALYINLNKETNDVRLFFIINYKVYFFLGIGLNGIALVLERSYSFLGVVFSMIALLYIFKVKKNKWE